MKYKNYSIFVRYNFAHKCIYTCDLLMFNILFNNNDHPYFYQQFVRHEFLKIKYKIKIPTL